MEIPACAGMTVVSVGMTVVGVGMTVVSVGMTVVVVGMALQKSTDSSAWFITNYIPACTKL